jgi:acylglycerol lipase
MKETHMSAQPPIDQQTREDEGSFTGVGGLKIFTRTWHPEGAPRAIVVIVPGFNSHSGYYRWVAEQFVAHGLAVHALDLRGRGQSDGERFYVGELPAEGHSLSF